MTSFALRAESGFLFHVRIASTLAPTPHIEKNSHGRGGPRLQEGEMRLLGMLLVSLTFVAALGPTGAGDAFAGGAVLMAQSEEDELTEEDFACLFGDECEGYLEEEFEEEEFSDEELDRMACEDALSPEECDELGIGVGSEEPACVADMESNRQQMIALALECGASCDLIG